MEVASLNAGSFVEAFGTGQARRPQLRLELSRETGPELKGLPSSPALSFISGRYCPRVPV